MESASYAASIVYFIVLLATMHVVFDLLPLLFKLLHQALVSSLVGSARWSSDPEA